MRGVVIATVLITIILCFFAATISEKTVKSWRKLIGGDNFEC